jgi:hypothetical protein
MGVPKILFRAIGSALVQLSLRYCKGKRFDRCTHLLQGEMYAQPSGKEGKKATCRAKHKNGLGRARHADAAAT